MAAAAARPTEAVSGEATFYYMDSAARWAKLVELLLHPPYSPASDNLRLYANYPAGETVFELIVPQESIKAALDLVEVSGVHVEPVTSVSVPELSLRPRPNTYVIVADDDWVEPALDAKRVLEGMRVAGFKEPSDWIARHFKGRRITTEMAVQACIDWLSPQCKPLPSEFKPSA